MFGDNVPPDSFANNLSGPVIGGQIGFNYQSGPIVLGIEALVECSHVKGNHASTARAADDQFSSRIRAIARVTGRVGYAWNNLLIYGKAGYGAADISVSVTGSVGLFTGSGADRTWRGGPIVGVGLEYGLTSDLSIAVEYDYQYLGTGSYQIGDATGSYRWEVAARNFSTLTAKINYRFH